MATETPDVEGRPESPPHVGAGRRLLAAIDGWVVAATLAAIMPVVVAAVSRIRSGWQPADDDAAIARLAHDVFSTHTPLLGMPSTIGDGVAITGGGSPHHLGPMLFWLFAIPDRLTGSAPSALIVTIALTNALCIAAIAWLIHQRGGRHAAVAAMLGVSVMIWGLGRGITVQIWNPYAALLPLLLFLVLAWAAACGDRIALPAAVVVGSFVMQCHVLYVPLVSTVSLGAIVSVFLRERAARSAESVTDRWRRDRRVSFIVTGALLAVCWCTAAYDQLFHRSGNLTRLWHSFNGSRQPALGARDAFRYTMRSVAIPPLFMRHVATLAANVGLAGPLKWWTVVGASVVLLAIVYFSWLARRTALGRTRLGVLALLTLAGSVLLLARLPIALGGVYPYRTRYLWIVGLYTWIALAVLVAPRVAGFTSRLASHDRTHRLAVVALVVLTALTVSGGVVASAQTGPAYSAPPGDSATIARLTAQVRRHLPDRGPYVLQLSGAAAIATIGFGVMWDLERHGYDIRVPRSDVYLGATHGASPGARLPGIVVVSSGPGYEPGPGAARVAFVDTAPGIRQRQRAARSSLTSLLERARPQATAAGRTLLRSGSRNVVVDGLRTLSTHSPDWAKLLDTHLLRLMVIAGFVLVPRRTSAALESYDELVNESADPLLSVYVTPPPRSRESG